MHLDRVVERHQLVEQRVVQLAGEPPRQLRAEQIRTSDGADEQRVTGEHARRLAGLLDEDRDVLGRMAGRVQEAAREIADRDDLAVARFVVLAREIRSRGPRCLRAERRELAGAGHEIGVDVRLDRVRDPQLVACGGFT